MKLALNVCFLFLIVGNVCSQLVPIDDPELEIYDHAEEDPLVDYPSFYLLGNVEENEIETEDDKRIPDATDKINTEDDLGPLPSVFELENNNKFSDLEDKINKLVADLKTQQDKITNLEDANKKLVLKIDSIEQEIKTNSIILNNVHQKPNESSKITLQKVLHVFNRVMRVRTSADDIAVALRAKSNSSGHIKPIVVKFTNFATKMKVLSQSSRLAHTNMTVSSDYSELVAHKRVALLPYLQAARSTGRRAFMLYDRLLVDGETYSLEELDALGELPGDLHHGTN